METPAHSPRLVPGGLALGDSVAPLLSGSLHYFRVPSERWPACLDALKRMGVGVVESYVPWSLHQAQDGSFSFSGSTAHPDLFAFLRAVKAAGLHAMLRVGPSCNGELTGFGIPRDILWDEACQARSPGGKPVLVAALPQAFPAPSLASSAYLSEAEVWLEAVGRALVPFVHPAGPLVLLQVDNEASLFVRDGVYDQDYHPDAVAAYRAFLMRRYRSLEALRDAYGDGGLTLESLRPPERFNAQTSRGLARHLDWAEFQEHLSSDAVGFFCKALRRAGLDTVPITHNLPRVEQDGVLSAALLLKHVEALTLNYHPIGLRDARRWLARRSTELRARAEHTGTPAIAAELAAGFAPHLPAVTPEEGELMALTALAYGVNAFNVYMAVDRDRWVGAPISQLGEPRAGFQSWQRLCLAVVKSGLAQLSRHEEVYVVIPRSYLRLCRVLHAFGPLHLGFFRGLGLNPKDTASEDDLGLSEATVATVEAFILALETALEAEGLTFAYCSDHELELALGRGRWTIVLSAGGFEPDVRARLQVALDQGQAVSFGPIDVTRDAQFRPLLAPPLRPREEASGLPAWLGSDEEHLREVVSHAREALGLRRILQPAPGVFRSVFFDAEGAERVTFLICQNPRPTLVELESAQPLRDLMSGERFVANGGSVKVPLRALSARMLQPE